MSRSNSLWGSPVAVHGSVPSLISPWQAPLSHARVQRGRGTRTQLSHKGGRSGSSSWRLADPRSPRCSWPGPEGEAVGDTQVRLLGITGPTHVPCWPCLPCALGPPTQTWGCVQHPHTHRQCHLEVVGEFPERQDSDWPLVRGALERRERVRAKPKPQGTPPQLCSTLGEWDQACG